MSEIPEIPEIPLFKKEILEKRGAVQYYYVMINIFPVGFPYTYGMLRFLYCKLRLSYDQVNEVLWIVFINLL